MTGEVVRASGWVTVAAPAGTPKPIFDKPCAARCNSLRCTNASAAWVEVLDKGTPEGFMAEYRNELPMWYRLIKASGIRLD